MESLDGIVLMVLKNRMVLKTGFVVFMQKVSISLGFGVKFDPSMFCEMHAKCLCRKLQIRYHKLPLIFVSRLYLTLLDTSL